jgi:hypothetical protein
MKFRKAPSPAVSFCSAVFGLFFAAHVFAVDVDKVRSMTDAEILVLNARGDFSKTTSENVSVDGLMRICEWVEADRRDIVTQLVKANPEEASTMYPLLACSLTEEAYRYWQSLGASNGRLGTATQHEDEERWGRNFDNRTTSLQIAAANMNAVSVSMHLADGVAVNERGSKNVNNALGAALNGWFWVVRPDCWNCARWSVAGETIYEQPGYATGLFAAKIIYGRLLEPVGDNIPRRRKEDLESAIQSVRLLLEAGASLDDLAGVGYMAANGLGYEGWREFGETYRKQFANDPALGITLPRLIEAERYATEIKSYIGNCKNWDMNACNQILAKADALSPNRKLANHQIATLQKTQSDWDTLIAKQSCTLSDKNWAYAGTSCLNGLADGQGSAVKWWTGETFTGNFRAGVFADGKYNTKAGVPVFEGRFYADGKFAAGKVYEEGKPVYDGAFDEAGKRQGNGICWVDGSPEECRYHDGERFDSLYKQRLENQKLKQEITAMQKDQQDREMKQAQEAHRQQKERDAEDRRERRNEQALAAGLAAARGDYSAAVAADVPLASTLQMIQNSNRQLNEGLAALKDSQKGSTNTATSSVSDKSAVTQAVQTTVEKVEDIDALGNKKMTNFRCEWATVSQPEGEEPIAVGPCHAADMAAHQVQCRPDWLGLPETLRLYECAVEHSTGRFKKIYEEAVQKVRDHQNQ